MSTNLVKKWSVVQIKTNSYDLATRNLTRQGFETFVPKMKVTVKRENSFIDKSIFVFPGYMFVSAVLENSNWAKIKSTYGVSKLLVFNNKPYEISHDLVLALKKRYGSNISSTKQENLYKGDVIKFNSGPFVDIIARIESVDEKNRIWVLLDSIGTYKKLIIKQMEKLNFTKV